MPEVNEPTPAFFQSNKYNDKLESVQQTALGTAAEAVGQQKKTMDTVDITHRAWKKISKMLLSLDSRRGAAYS